MAGWIRDLCLLAIFCGAAQALSPEGSGKRALRFVCAVVLLSCAVGGLRKTDLGELQGLTEGYRAREQDLMQRGEELREQSERAVIARSYAAYIWDKAALLGTELEDVQVDVTQRGDGIWVPERVWIWSGQTEEELQELRDAIAEAFASPELLWERGSDGMAQ